jgi:hypothetical protein
MKKYFVFFVILFFLHTNAGAQRKVTTVGIQVKPIFPNSFLSAGTTTVYQDNVRFDLTLASGYSAGMMVRHGFSDLLAIESGINFVKRSHELKITDGSFEGTSKFRIIGYEIPVNLLVYIRLGEKIFMNASMGPSVDMFASDVQSSDDYYSQRSYRNNIFQPAVNGNLGVEYRTLKSGFFYVGASYHQPFSYIYATEIYYRKNPVPVIETLDGNYFTLDLRYFFYEDPKKKTPPKTEDEE